MIEIKTSLDLDCIKINLSDVVSVKVEAWEACTTPVELRLNKKDAKRLIKALTKELVK